MCEFMKVVHWIGAGIGSLFSGGFLTFLGSVPLGAAAASGIGFGSLPLVLEALGLVFVGYGVVRDFVLNKLEAQGDKENGDAKP